MMYQYKHFGTGFALQMTGPSHYSLDDHVEMTVLLVVQTMYERGVVTQMSHDTCIRRI